MARKPNRASGYAADQVEHVRATCLYVATKLGDLADETVIVGGLVPSLLIDQNGVGGAEGVHERDRRCVTASPWARTAMDIAAPPREA